MLKSMAESIKTYILKFCIYQEPLHILVGALQEAGLYTSAEGFSDGLIGLLKEGYVRVEEQSEDGYEWLIVVPTRKELIEYIQEREKEKFEKYPEEERYVRTTDKGLAFLREARPSELDRKGTHS